jgi:hypothetical protein
MILTISTVALEKEIGTRQIYELRPGVSLDDNVAIEIQRPVEIRLLSKPTEQIHLDAIPDLEFIRPKGC